MTFGAAVGCGLVALLFAGEEVAKAPYTDAQHEPAIIGSVQYTHVEMEAS